MKAVVVIRVNKTFTVWDFHVCQTLTVEFMAVVAVAENVTKTALLPIVLEALIVGVKKIVATINVPWETALESLARPTLIAVVMEV